MSEDARRESVERSLVVQKQKIVGRTMRESRCIYPDPETGGHIESKKHTYDWKNVCIFCAYPRWGRCKSCGKPLTEKEQNKLEDRCFQCNIKREVKNDYGRIS